MDNKEIKTKNTIDRENIIDTLQLAITTICELPIQIKYAGTMNKCISALTEVLRALNDKTLEEKENR